MGRRDAWGAQAIALGVWEAAAFLGACPTVTGAVASLRRRYGRSADLAVAGWLLGLGLHLYRRPRA
jgi:hypothetical protein